MITTSGNGRRSTAASEATNDPSPTPESRGGRCACIAETVGTAKHDHRARIGPTFGDRRRVASPGRCRGGPPPCGARDSRGGRSGLSHAGIRIPGALTDFTSLSAPLGGSTLMSLRAIRGPPWPGGSSSSLFLQPCSRSSSGALGRSRWREDLWRTKDGRAGATRTPTTSRATLTSLATDLH